MKVHKYRRVKIILSVLPFSSGIIFLSCGNPLENDPQQIFGTWFNETAGIYSEAGCTDTLFYVDRIEIQFIYPHVTKRERKIFDKETNIFLGYRYRDEGSFYTSGDQLNIYTDKAAYNDDEVSFYSDGLELIPIKCEPERVTYKIYNDLLQFIYPPCPPDANCITDQLFFRRNY